MLCEGESQSPTVKSSQSTLVVLTLVVLEVLLQWSKIKLTIRYL